jgi:histidyl-tRNA synthetase
VVEGSAPPGFNTADATPAAAPAPAPAKKSKTNAAEEEEVDESQVGVGSIAAGGRYDNLVGMFSAQGPTKGRIPCVGISFGVERIYSLLRQKALKDAEQKMKTKDVDVFVMSLGDGMFEERLTTVDELWSSGIRVRRSLLAALSADQ